MKIKKVDDKPMVIHTKKKAKLHTHEPKKASIKQAKPYQVGIYARLSYESEANKERDTVDTQIAYIREFVKEQDDMVEVQVYADISVTGTTFERPEFDRIQDLHLSQHLQSKKSAAWL